MSTLKNVAALIIVAVPVAVALYKAYQEIRKNEQLKEQIKDAAQPYVDKAKEYYYTGKNRAREVLRSEEAVPPADPM